MIYEEVHLSFFISNRFISNWPLDVELLSNIQGSTSNRYWENFKVTDHKYQFRILKIIAFLIDIGYSVKLLSNH